MEIFIEGNVPSSKNSKVWTGRFLVWSKTANRYRKDTRDQWVKNSEAFKEATQGIAYPMRVSFKFIRGSKHKFDLVNPLQTALDLMVEHGWIEDDNADIILPSFEKYEYNKDKPGVWIKILK